MEADVLDCDVVYADRISELSTVFIRTYHSPSFSGDLCSGPILFYTADCCFSDVLMARENASPRKQVGTINRSPNPSSQDMSSHVVCMSIIPKNPHETPHHSLKM